MRFTSLREALIHEMRDLHSAEVQLLAVLPRMAAGATSNFLQTAFDRHFIETKEHVMRLERALSLVSSPVTAETCEAMQGLIEEVNEILSAQGDAKVIDALLIGAAQRIEHYEIAAYGTARAFAANLGLAEVAEILQHTLNEEGAADRKLTTIAEDGWVAEGVNTGARKAANL